MSLFIASYHKINTASIVENSGRGKPWQNFVKQSFPNILPSQIPGSIHKTNYISST